MTQQISPFVESGVDPLLAELTSSISIHHTRSDPFVRLALQDFIRDVFHQAHDAEVTSFYPNLLGFSTGSQLHAVMGYRIAGAAPLFSEQYLDTPAHELASTRLGMPVEREQMVEVGNLAILDPGQARWVIAASTSFLAAAGYRWVVFTATRTLANAFRRLGLKPLELGTADPRRLPDAGASWGTYYMANPAVYVGDIHAGLGKLGSTRSAAATNLNQLLHAAHALGTQLAGSPELFVPGRLAVES